MVKTLWLTTLGILLRLKFNIMHLNQNFTGKHSLQNMVDYSLSNPSAEALNSTYYFHLRSI